jgi:hypothetical protein
MPFTLDGEHRGSTLHRPPAVADELIQAAWYLHGVASASAALNVYEPARQRHAFQISAHVFDLTLLARPLPRENRLRFSFAAHLYDLTPPTADAGVLLEEIDQDSTATFWG